MTHWNFKRPELAEHYLSLFETGLYSNIAIIAPRRKGKTLFMLQDLAPLAMKRGYMPVYASLWQNINSPQEGLIQALQEALGATQKKSTLGKLLNAKVKKTTISNELLGKMEVEFADNPEKVNNKELALIEHLIQELEKNIGKKTILLLIDEVQHLATSPVFDPLTHSLRTLIDKRQGSIKAIFTGSSRHYMNLLFNQSQAPFYHFVGQVAFPDLDDSFIEFIKHKLDKEHGITVSIDRLSSAFNQFDRSPYWMIKLIGHLVTFGRSFNASLDYTLQLIEETEGFADILKRLKPIDKLVFIAITDGENMYSKEFLSKIEKETRLRGIAPNVQRSIGRLQNLQLVSQISKGEYHIEKSGFKNYLLESMSKDK